MRRLCRWSSLMLVLVCAYRATGQTTDGKTALWPNAALQYWQAFSQLPVTEKEHEAVFSEPTAAALAQPATVKLLDGARQSFVFLDRGSQLAVCDWGLEYTDGVSLLLPHLAKGRDLASLAALDARRAFERGDFKTARKRLWGIMKLGRDVRRDPVLISVLVGSGLEVMAIDAAAPYIPDWKPSYADAVSMLEKLPPAMTFEQSLSMEKRSMAEWIVKKLREEGARGPDAWREFWKALFTGSEAEPPMVASAEAAAKMVEELLPVYDELQTFAKMPRERFDAEYPAFKARTKAKYPLAGLLLPAVDMVRDRLQRQEAKLAMMLAAISMVESGPAKLRDTRDPFGSGPFGYRVLDNQAPGKSFELQSKAIFEGQPVTLTVGQRK